MRTRFHDVSDSCCHSKVQRILKGKTFVFSIGKSGYYGVFCTDGASHGYTREIYITGLFFGDIDGALAIYGDIDRFKVAAYEPREFVVVGFFGVVALLGKAGLKGTAMEVLPSLAITLDTLMP